MENQKPDMSVDFAGIKLKNPVMTASGTFGSGMEYGEYVDLSRLGAIVTKGVSSTPWSGNPTPRVAEVPSGMLNAIGLQNPGVETFIARDLAALEKEDVVVGVNVCGHSREEYLEVVEALADQKRVDFLEINISCPNVKQGALAFGQDPREVEAITKAIKAKAKAPVIMKLTPNVTSIAEIAKAAEAGGADGISLINTLTGMKVDVERQKFLLANKTGGMSGPAVHPIAVRMVYEAAKAVSLPIIGMGGITTWEDAVEMMLVGATAVSVGTANFMNPTATVDIIEGMEDYLSRHGIGKVSDLIGSVQE
ncbi:MAG: dihydroorotate dehydrogenase [Lachnospiraceae bacterium]|nr:dihydroorotate dehydrogenase [Lachnospiraceae bacterium]MBQ2577214.1 dihydroorotate dehydrogenase [Lachnospiraceae bacterium]MBQ5483873.1 dihydroorotate dehydrogenase [Lachnospiraceae bacterium]MEE3355560.1 dihydroorotate dehydrogenase [Candidatus Weimeria sp.]